MNPEAAPFRPNLATRQETQEETGVMTSPTSILASSKEEVNRHK